MKKSIEVISLPIINISDGSECGKVKSLVVNPEKGSIDFLTIENEEWQTSVKAVPFKKVVGIGEYAVTVESNNAIIDLNEIPIANQLVNRKVKIISTRIMTRKGQLLGSVKEYFLDDDNGQIIGLIVEVNGEEKILDSEAVITYGKDIIIVNEHTKEYFRKGIQEVGEQEQDLEEVVHDEEVEEILVQETEQVSNQDVELKALRQKQVQLLTGKVVSKDIYSKSGQLLFTRGLILTEQDVNAAQQEGPSVVVELSMNVEA